ncbi:MAG TPA: hypothetical protein VH188_00750 [Chthoniobacterales bacterium]|jgi:hypothetical protein|nr:hypothetical protein [Chthoniobacterales bacterium]
MSTGTRILLAGLLGAVAMFAWTAIAHMALPLGEAGIQNTKDDEALLSELKSTVKNKDGFYMYPDMGLAPGATHAQQSAAMEKYTEKLEKNPHGLFIFHPAGSHPMNMGKFLTIEFITELCEAFIVVWLLAQTRIVSFGGRVGFVTAAGILAAITTNVSYWNWYGFPGNYTASYMFIQVVGFFLVGIVAALMFRRVTA